MATRYPAISLIPLAATAAALALATPATAQTPTREYFIGIWSFDGSCASGYGMGLRPDGEVWYDEWGSGLWILENGAIRMILQESEMGVDEVLGVLPLTIEIETVEKDGFIGRYLEDGAPVTATRCE